MKFSIKKIALLAVLAALAYVIMAFIRIPIMPAAPFLEYDAKDIFFVLAGFLLGPVESLIIIVLVCLLEMVTVSTSGPIGLLMNVISSIFFVLPAALVYKKKRSLPSAIIGLTLSVFGMTSAMILWNYFVTPGYMHVDRSVVVSMLPTVFLPFNIIKAGINMALTLMIYKPLSIALHKARILDDINNESKAKGESSDDKKEVSKKSEAFKNFNPIAILTGMLILALCVAAILIMQ